MLRPEIEKLLRGQYEVTVDGRVHHVGFELTAARVLGPRDGVVFKARRYQQIDEDRETSVERDRSTQWGGGPEAGGGADESATTARTPLEMKNTRGLKETSAMAETLEHNKEGVRPFRLLVFDVTVTARPADGRGAPTFEVDVPDGLIAMLPLRNGALADGLEDHLAGLLAARSPREEPAPEPAGDGASTAVVSPPERKRAALPPVAEVWEDEQQAEADFLVEEKHGTDDARWGELLWWRRPLPRRPRSGPERGTDPASVSGPAPPPRRSRPWSTTCSVRDTEHDPWFCRNPPARRRNASSWRSPSARGSSGTTTGRASRCPLLTRDPARCAPSTSIAGATSCPPAPGRAAVLARPGERGLRTGGKRRCGPADTHSELTVSRR
jgi:hypothetical protein